MYYSTPSDLAITAYSRTSAVADFGKAVLTQLYPDKVPTFVGELPPGFDPLLNWEAYIPKVDGATDVILILEDPIVRFKKHYADVKDVHSLDFVFQIVEGAVPSIERFITDTNRVYRVDLHKDELEAVLGLTSVTVSDCDVELTTEHEDRLREIFAADYEIYNSITTAGQVYTKPVQAPYVPSILTTRQFWLAALEYGFDRDAIISMVDSLPEGNPLQLAFKKTAKIDLYTATEYHRDNATLAAIAGSLGVTSNDLDKIFIKGETL